MSDARSLNELEAISKTVCAATVPINAAFKLSLLLKEISCNIAVYGFKEIKS